DVGAAARRGIERGTRRSSDGLAAHAECSASVNIDTTWCTRVDLYRALACPINNRTGVTAHERCTSRVVQEAEHDRRSSRSYHEPTAGAQVLPDGRCNGVR